MLSEGHANDPASHANASGTIGPASDVPDLATMMGATVTLLDWAPVLIIAGIFIGSLIAAWGGK